MSNASISGLSDTPPSIATDVACRCRFPGGVLTKLKPPTPLSGTEFRPPPAGLLTVPVESLAKLWLLCGEIDPPAHWKHDPPASEHALLRTSTADEPRVAPKPFSPALRTVLLKSWT